MRLQQHHMKLRSTRQTVKDYNSTDSRLKDISRTSQNTQSINSIQSFVKLHSPGPAIHPSQHVNLVSIAVDDDSENEPPGINMIELLDTINNDMELTPQDIDALQVETPESSVNPIDGTNIVTKNDSQSNINNELNLSQFDNQLNLSVFEDAIDKQIIDDIEAVENELNLDAFDSNNDISENSEFEINKDVSPMNLNISILLDDDIIGNLVEQNDAIDENNNKINKNLNDSLNANELSDDESSFDIDEDTGIIYATPQSPSSIIEKTTPTTTTTKT